MGLKEVWDKVESAVADLTSLDVVTLTGNVVIKAKADSKGLDLGGLYEEIAEQAAATTDASLEVVAFTHLDFDMDTVNFVKKGLVEEEKVLIQAHAEVLKASQEARLGVIRLVKSIVT